MDLLGPSALPGEGQSPKGEGDVLVLFCDGAARGNPGPAGAGAIIYDGQGRELARLKRYLGQATNNVAEYEALLLGLEKARSLGAKRLWLRLDSELLVKQLKGLYRVKSARLKPRSPERAGTGRPESASNPVEKEWRYVHFQKSLKCLRK